MTKQEEIRERIANLIKENTQFTKGKYSPLAGPITSGKREMWCRPSYLASEILSYLHSQDVVIKVERELPQRLIHFKKAQVFHWFPYGGKEADVQREMLKAGYVAVEPLIEDKQ